MGLGFGLGELQPYPKRTSNPTPTAPPTLPQAHLVPGARGVDNAVLEALQNGRDIISGRAKLCVLPAAIITGDNGICGSEPC